VLLHVWYVDWRSYGSRGLLPFFGAEFLEHFFADLKARLCGPGYLLELHDIGQIREQLGRLEGRFGID
jgi:hypothetical protein